MKLSHFNGKICKNMMDMMPSIKVVYQMEQEFHPYLDIEFLTNSQHDENLTGIVLQTQNGIIKKYSDFNTKKDVDDLRDMIWDALLKQTNLRTVDECNQNNDRVKKPDHVIQGWSNVVKEHKKHIYPKISKDILPLPKENLLRSLNPVFRKSENDVQTKDTCKKMRFQECSDNYAPASAEFGRCMAEVNWLCDNGYPNILLNRHNEYASKVWTDLNNNLCKNDGYVNKKQFDNIIDAGMFYDLGMRSGNKYIEKFDGWNAKPLLFILLVIIVGIMYWKN